MKIRTITFGRGYKLSHDFQGVDGRIEATAEAEEGETEQEAYAALRKQVLPWLGDDCKTGKKLLHAIAADVKTS